MSENPPSEPKNKNVDELTLLTQIIESLLPLDDGTRIRLLKSAITFLHIDISIGNRSAANIPSTTETALVEPVGSFSARTEMSPKQFMLEKQPSNDIERVVCLAYYLTHYRNMPEFKTLDISKLNTEAAQPKFSNASVPIDHATRRGFIVSTSGWNKQIGAFGEQFVQALPDREAAKAVIERLRFKKPRRKRNGGSEAPETPLGEQ